MSQTQDQPSTPTPDTPPPPNPVGKRAAIIFMVFLFGIPLVAILTGHPQMGVSNTLVILGLFVRVI